ncbi:hypothetical protein [Yersinia ruckeri]|uniref:transcriptional antitermination N peptide n=1 Tax=Yersinia ruckeri TaxID=29486 RepID=UPI002238030D|nr:hypothetical protein [Yersinia ruckeri]MCW6607263.1 hypothetical protein [Yersinia ruckeri]MCW6614175.1 hypothetical protein [Yersinia ruckeri]
MTRRTAFTGSSSARRREARKHLQLAAVNEFSTELKVERPTPSKVELTCKRKPAMRAEVMTITRRVQYAPSADNICLPEVAKFAAGFRNVREDCYHVIK